MKKTLIVVLLAVSLAAPISASAQTVTNEQLLSIIQSLVQQVLVLMEQLQKIEAAQATQSQTLGAIQTQVTPVVMTPTQPSLSVSFGSPFCSPGDPEKVEVEVPVTISGSNWRYGSVMFSYGGGRSFEKGLVPATVILNKSGSVTLTTTLTNTQPTKYNQYQYLNPVYQNTYDLVVPNCQ